MANFLLQPDELVQPADADARDIEIAITATNGDSDGDESIIVDEDRPAAAPQQTGNTKRSRGKKQGNSEAAVWPDGPPDQANWPGGPGTIAKALASDSVHQLAAKQLQDQPMIRDIISAYNAIAKKYNDAEKNAKRNNTQITSKPMIYGIIIQRPLTDTTTRRPAAVQYRIDIANDEQLAEALRHLERLQAEWGSESDQIDPTVAMDTSADTAPTPQRAPSLSPQARSAKGTPASTPQRAPSWLSAPGRDDDDDDDSSSDEDNFGFQLFPRTAASQQGTPEWQQTTDFGSGVPGDEEANRERLTPEADEYNASNEEDPPTGGVSPSPVVAMDVDEPGQPPVPQLDPAMPTTTGAPTSVVTATSNLAEAIGVDDEPDDDLILRLYPAMFTSNVAPPHRRHVTLVEMIEELSRNLTETLAPMSAEIDAIQPAQSTPGELRALQRALRDLHTRTTTAAADVQAVATKARERITELEAAEMAAFSVMEARCYRKREEAQARMEHYRQLRDEAIREETEYAQRRINFKSVLDGN